MENYSKIVPDSYQITTTDKTSKVINKENGEWFFLTNRHFEEIDHSFAHLPSKTIDALQKKLPPNSPIRILDIGSGINAQSATDIADRHKQLQVFSLDLTASKNNSSNINRIVGNMLKLPITDNSIDMAYSRMSATLVIEYDQNNISPILSEVSRVLKPGGLFFLDNEFRSPQTGSNQKYLEEISKTNNVSFYTKSLGLFLNPVEAIINKLDSNYPDTKFLILAKHPIDQKLIDRIGLKPKDKII